MRIQVLGPLRVSAGGAPVDLGPAGQRAVLGLLALAGGQPLGTAEIIASLWADRPPASATNVVQTHVKRLRRVLEPDRPPRAPSAVLPRIGDGYALRPAAADLDLLGFRRLVAAAAGARRGGDPKRVADLLGQALSLWYGTPLADVPVLAGHPKVTALVEERRTALGHYGEAMIASGAAVDVLAELEETATALPLDEAWQARLIRGYHAAGRRAHAFARFHETRRRLAEELGVDPGPELVAAHAALLRDRPDAPAGPRPGESRPAGPGTASADEPDPPAPAPGRPVPAQLPADVPGFVGRSAELARLDAQLAAASPDPGQVLTIAISGTAGVGKTALAVRWAHRVRAGFPDGQLYLNLRGYDPEQPVPATEALARLLRALGTAGQDIPVDLDERAAAYRSLVDGRRLLIVLDNASSVDQVRPLLPGTAACVTLVTSRNPLAGLVARHGAHRLDLALLPPDDATELLNHLLGDRAAAEPAAVLELVDRCARLPLALRVAAERCLARPGLALARLVDELADRQRRLDLLDAGGDRRTGVRAVLSWSYEQLPAAAARAFRLLGLHPGADFDDWVVAALTGTDLDTAGRLIESLARAYLVQPAGVDRFGLHDLLRAYAADLAAEHEPAAERLTAQTGLLDHYLRTASAAIDTLYPAERHRRPAADAAPEGPLRPAVDEPGAAQAWLDVERANLVAVVAHAAAHGWPTHAVRLCIVLLRYVESGGHYTAAVTMHDHALRAVRELADPAAEAHLLTNLAVMHAQHGRYEESARRLREAVGLCRESDDPVGEARALGNLGHVYRWQGRFGEATERLIEALALCRRTGDLASQARALGNLGHVYLLRGSYEPAGERLREAAALCHRISDPVGEAYALVSLGHVDLRQGRLRAAAEYFGTALGLFRTTSERAGEAYALDGLGRLELCRGRTAEALDHIQQALVLFRQVGERSGEALAINSFGEALTATDRPAQAAVQHASALGLAVEVGDRYEQARANAGLAGACLASGDSAGAARYRHEAARLYDTLGVPEPGRHHAGARPEGCLSRSAPGRGGR